MKPSLQKENRMTIWKLQCFVENRKELKRNRSFDKTELILGQVSSSIWNLNQGWENHLPSHKINILLYIVGSTYILAETISIMQNLISLRVKESKGKLLKTHTKPSMAQGVLQMADTNSSLIFIQPVLKTASRIAKCLQIRRYLMLPQDLFPLVWVYLRLKWGGCTLLT